MKIRLIDKANPAPDMKGAQTFVCDICGKEKDCYEVPLQPLVIQDNVGDTIIRSLVCNEHYHFGGSDFDFSKFTYTPKLLELKFMIQNKVKELRGSFQTTKEE